MKRKYDIVVIGAGPAGSMLAYDLASRGVDVLLVEKHRLPRYKPCGGGLTRRSLDLLPFEMNGILEDRVTTARLHLNGTTISEERTSDPMIGMVMRDTFDHFMVQRAVDAGAVLKENAVFSVLHRAGKRSHHRIVRRDRPGEDRRGSGRGQQPGGEIHRPLSSKGLYGRS